jgi:hypothetical protein
LLVTLGLASLWFFFGATGPAESLMPWTPDTVHHWRRPIERAAEAHGVSPELIAIQMIIESGGDPSATSSMGAVGLMQVMPATAAEIAQRRGIRDYDLRDPATNIDFGAWYLAQQWRAFGSPGLSAAAYNGGPGMVLDWQAGRGMVAESARARRFVDGMWRERRKQRSPTYEDWLRNYGTGLIASARANQGARPGR